VSLADSRRTGGRQTGSSVALVMRCKGPGSSLVMAGEGVGEAGIRRLVDLMGSDGLIAPLLAIRGLANSAAAFDTRVQDSLSYLARAHPSKRVRREATELLTQGTLGRPCTSYTGGAAAPHSGTTVPVIVSATRRREARRVERRPSHAGIGFGRHLLYVRAYETWLRGSPELSVAGSGVCRTATRVYSRGFRRTAGAGARTQRRRAVSRCICDSFWGLRTM
jgi:hypothetical protein